MDVGRAGVLVRRATPPALLDAAKQGVRQVGCATASMRVLPDYLIAGTKKGGTTSLANWLVQHPGVLRMFPRVQRHKSAHYFDSNFGKGQAWYRSHFPTRQTQSRVAQRVGYRPVVGEASPYYMFHPAVPDRVRSMLPDCRVIMLLRDPVARAYSQYWDRVSTGFEHLSTFEAAIDAEPERLGDVDEARFFEPSYEHYSYEHHSYLARGRYAQQLTRWLRVFGPEQLLVLEFERMRSDPEALLAEVLAFLGLPAHSAIDLRPRNERTSQPPLAETTRRRLQEYFRPYNADLVRLTGRTFSWAEA
jgi:hypothetical protein